MSRYHRQMILPDIGRDGQEAIRRAKVLCVGAGGLGSSALYYLAAAGVGSLGIVDGDRVDVSNLQRQILFAEREQGCSKVQVAKKRLEELNPEVHIEIFDSFLSPQNVKQIFSDYHVVLDGTDNFSTKFLINDAAVSLGLPVVFASVLQFQGQLSVFWAKKGPCYRCIYPSPPKGYVPNCAEAGVLGALAGMLGSMQALEALKLIVAVSNNGLSSRLQPLVGKFLTADAQDMSFKQYTIEKDPDCPVCQRLPEEIRFEELLGFCGVPDAELELEVADLDREHRPLLIDVREREEWEREAIPEAELIPLSVFSEALEAKVSKEQEIVLYCQSGIRSLQAVKEARRLGYDKAYHLKGGIEAWKQKQ